MRKTIEINCAVGPLSVIADVQGALAVHQCHDLRGLWAVTHIPTGLSCGFMDSKVLAVTFRERIEGLVDWSKVSMGVGFKPKGIPAKVRREIIAIRAELQGLDYD